MKVIFLGLMYCEQSFKEAFAVDKAGVQVAPQVFQTNLLKGFNENDYAVKTINVPPTGSFPINNKKLFFRKNIWGKENVQVGFINLPIIKHVIQERKIYLEILKEIKKDPDVGLVLYTIYKPFLKVVNKIKRKFPNVQVAVIQTDPVPGRGEFNKVASKRQIKKGNKLVKLAKVCDKFVLLTDYLKDTIECGDREYIVMECVCDSDAPIVKRKDQSKNVCLYAGGLWKDYGIDDLVDAFKLIPEGELWLCGGGGSVPYIKDAQEKYPNIKYFGFVDREKIKELQENADFMINPRRPTGTFTKYSFPSKTVEYMVTAKPTIMYKLEGVPDEYDGYINYLSGDNGDDIAKELKELFSIDYNLLLDKASKARDFVLNEKSPKVQAKRIVDLIKTR